VNWRVGLTVLFPRAGLLSSFFVGRFFLTSVVAHNSLLVVPRMQLLVFVERLLSIL
jgi:hypothetical protein